MAVNLWKYRAVFAMTKKVVFIRLHVAYIKPASRTYYSIAVRFWVTETSTHIIPVTGDYLMRYKRGHCRLVSTAAKLFFFEHIFGSRLNQSLLIGSCAFS